MRTAVVLLFMTPIAISSAIIAAIVSAEVDPGTATTGFGLRGMRERVDLLDGRLEVVTISQVSKLRYDRGGLEGGVGVKVTPE